jgi:peptidoglycan/xylan/chitin deacetylase (PgdA/CDA1 family)
MRSALGAVTRVVTEQRVAALTFDDGPHPEFTPRLLAILRRHEVRATFFMVGKAAARYPETVRRVAADGHTIGNHSWDHPSFPLISGRERRAQLRACATALAPYGHRLFRPPYGHLDLASRLDTIRCRHEVVGWSFGGEDWLDRDAAWMADRVVEVIRPGSIVVLHDALYHVLEEQYADRTPLLDAVDRFLGRLGTAFRFVSLPELLRAGTVRRRRSFSPPDVDFLNALQASVGTPRRYPSGVAVRVPGTD